MRELAPKYFYSFITLFGPENRFKEMSLNWFEINVWKVKLFKLIVRRWNLSKKFVTNVVYIINK